jgi:RNA recognition motif-containing protein
MPEYFGFCQVPFRLAGKGGRQELKEVFFMSAAKLYVGNLNYRTTEDKLKELFSQYGEVNSVNVLQGRGFGFVEMATQESAQDAKAKLNGTDFDGRRIIVNEARPRTERRGGERRERRDFDKF